MIIAISSREPLYEGERPEVEPLADYLASLRDGLNSMKSEGQDEIISIYSFITTHE